MTRPIQLNKAAQTARILLIAGFIALLWLPGLDGFFHWDKTPEVNENRAFAPFPSFRDSSSLRDYAVRLEAWHNDHFGFRKRLIYWERNWKRAWFGESLSYNVVIGQKGWMYYVPGETMESLRRQKLFTPGELAGWRSLLETRRDWLARRGIPYLVVIPPTNNRFIPNTCRTS